MYKIITVCFWVKNKVFLKIARLFQTKTAISATNYIWQCCVDACWVNTLLTLYLYFKRQISRARFWVTAEVGWGWRRWMFLLMWPQRCNLMYFIYLNNNWSNQTYIICMNTTLALQLIVKEISACVELNVPFV